MELEIAKFRKKLEEELVKASKRKNTTKEEIEEATRNLSRQINDIGEQAESNHRLGVNVGLCELSYLTLKKIEAALKRVDQGTYGECLNPMGNSKCEGFISEKRLEAVPWQETCLNCQEAQERQMHNPGLVVADLFDSLEEKQTRCGASV